MRAHTHTHTHTHVRTLTLVPYNNMFIPGPLGGFSLSAVSAKEYLDFTNLHNK